MIKQHFINGRMNLDSDERLLPKGDFRKAVNIRVSNSEGSEVGSIENVLGNEKLTNLSLGSNATTVGADRSVGLNTIYWLVASDNGSYFIEYNVATGTTSIILADTRVLADRVLNLSKSNPVNRIIIIENYDKDQTLALWTDGNEDIRCVNIDRAKQYGENNFTADAINLIKKPPKDRPGMTLEVSTSGLENNIEERFLRFAYSYKYLDGEYSALSNFTPVAFLGKSFNYDFSTNSNEGMVNTFNKALLTLNTGSELVVGIRLVFKESNSNTPYIVGTFNKEDEGWADNTEVQVEFTNNKNDGILPEDELFRSYDAVPRFANTIEIIDNTIAVADYTENYNLIDDQGGKVIIDTSLELVSEASTSGTAITTCKTIRDYEAGIVYLDGPKRWTSVLTHKNNTAHIPGSVSDQKNSLRFLINHKAPAFAKAYRIFIKQSKYEYDTVVPSLFYNDGAFVWIKLENGEKDKVSEGDFLVVKADSAGILQTYQETRVIEIVDQEKNFLEETETTDTKQLAGLYFKIKPSGAFRFNQEDFDVYESSSYTSSKPPFDDPIGTLADVIEPAVYYGGGTLDDMTSGGSYNGTSDVRYIIRIDGNGTPDTFIWSNNDGATFSAPVAITGSAQAIENGVEVTFASTTGHAIADEWIVSAKAQNDDGLGGDENNFTYALIKGLESNGNVNEEDVIEGSARINLVYNEYGEGDTTIIKNYVSSSRYANLEEWWFGDNIADDFNYPVPNRIWFRRGKLNPASGAPNFQIDSTGDMFLIIKSVADETGLDKRVIAVTSIEIVQSDNNILLETKSPISNSDTFFETGPTYPISSEGYHLGAGGTDIDQTIGNAATLNLDFWNCIGWGNGFESYKIKDDFNGKALNIDTRPNTFIDDYRENYRRGGITLSGRYEQTTNYNAINEFNYSLGNFVDLDDADGAVKFLFARGKTLIAFQENRVTPLGYKKTFEYSQDGTQNTVESDQLLSIPESYTGEYGISANPESFAFFGNRIYFVDPRRGAPMRLSIDGLSEINILTKDFFKDLFREHPNALYEGAYDPYFDEYLLKIIIDKEEMTIGFSENGYSADKKGWTSLYRFDPDKMVGINNRLYSLKDGQLWIHNSENVPRNNFYGIQYTSKVTTILNDDPLNDKLFKTLVLNGNKPWNITANTNLSETTIEKNEFKQKESRFYGYLRHNEDIDQLKGGAVQGLGNLQSFEGLVLTFNKVSELVNIGDHVYQVVDNNKQLLGEVESFTSTTITLVSLNNTPIEGSFCFNAKNPRIEGGNIRGYYLEVELENTDTDFVELFAVESNMVASDLHSK